VQCRACEVVCPSLVEFGSLIETARTELAEREPPRGLRACAPGRVLGAGAAALAAAGRRRAGGRCRRCGSTGCCPSGCGPPDGSGCATCARLPAPPDRAPACGGDAFVFRGCVMDQMFRDVHQAVADVLAAVGYTPRFEPGAAVLRRAARPRRPRGRGPRARRATIAAYAGTDGPDRGRLGRLWCRDEGVRPPARHPEAHAFSARVKDLSEVITPRRSPSGPAPVP
jgi:glycolate oxidase iron-sulfur subunit